MDVDLDFPDRSRALALFDHVIATRIENNEVKNHNSGVYVTRIPTDVRTNTSTIEYKSAEERGYFKIDFLNVGIYEGVSSEEHLLTLMNTAPVWELLEQDDFVNLLFHVNGYGNVLRQMKPRSVEQLAAVLAVIRPAKRHLLGKSWPEVMAEVWAKSENADAGYAFKKAHSISYAMAIIVQMNLICEGLCEGGA